MRRERFDKMNVVPFIDIVLVLLVIVLATATFVQNNRIRIDLPTASSRVQAEQNTSIITINQAGEYFYNHTPITFDALKAKLTTLSPQKTPIALHTDKATPFAYFVKVIDVMKAKGFENVAIVTKH